MKLKDNNTASLAVLVFVMAGLALTLMVQSNVAAVGAEKAGAKPMVLISVDEESVGYVRQAEEMAAEKNYADAIKILQYLLDRPEQYFVTTEDPHRFISLAVKVNEVIEQLPPEGMKLYRRLYDIKAERLFRIAAEQFDENALRDIVQRYFHTSYGDDALNLLGGIMFDRGEFSQAARCWSKIIRADDSGKSAVILARISVAHHFAGESKHASKILDLLIKRHPRTVAAFGGRDENVVAFTRRMLTLPPPKQAGPRLQHDWPCLAGAPDSVAVMSSCRPVLSLRWTAPGGKLKDNANIKAAPGGNRAIKPGTMLLREGRVTYGRGIQRMPIPALIHPIVVGSTVLYRGGGGVAAHDLLTGEKLWETISFPLFRPVTRIFSVPTGTVEDCGLWTVTAGSGKVFALRGQTPGFFTPIAPRLPGDSVLAAFSINNQGRLLWRLGDGAGDSDPIRGGLFLTAPTYVAGRLYVLVEYMESHYLVCLNAENGRLVWETVVARIPLRPRTGFSLYRSLNQSPPAVSGGKVFVVNNAGVVAAFDTDTGKGLWAYQYKSNVRLSAPPNPIIVTDGRAICLPSDCEQLLAFRTDTGRLEWSADRRGQHDLTAVDSSRLLLSGEGIHIIDAVTGKNIWKGEKIDDIHGRPAVTTDAILASGKGEIIRVSLKDFSVTRLPVKQPDAILGNLISAGGKLIAANAAGVSAYFPAASIRNNQKSEP